METQTLVETSPPDTEASAKAENPGAPETLREAFGSPKKALASLKSIVMETVREFLDDDAERLAASLAYYAIFSIAPLLVIVIGVAGFFFGNETAQAEIVEQVRALVGNSGAEFVAGILKQAWQPGRSFMATVMGGATLVLGATGAFAQLQGALNRVWGIKPSKGGLKHFVRKRLVSFSLVLTIGFLLMISLVLSAALAATGKYLRDAVPAYYLLINILNVTIAFGVSTFLFAAIYRILPDAEVRWRDTLAGAAATSLLFSLGKTLIGLYLGKMAATSAYGAAGSFVVVLLWVYYSTQILFFGAEFTQVWAQRFGPGIIPKPHAERI